MRLEHRDRGVWVEVVHHLHAPVVDVVEEVRQRQRRRQQEDRVHGHDRRRSPSARAASPRAQHDQRSATYMTTIAPVNSQSQRRAVVGEARPQPAQRAGHPAREEADVGGRRQQARPVGRHHHHEQAQRHDRGQRQRADLRARPRRARSRPPSRRERTRKPLRHARWRRAVETGSRATRRPAIAVRRHRRHDIRLTATTQRARRSGPSDGGSELPRSSGRLRPWGPSRPAPGHMRPSPPPATTGSPRR